MSEQVLVKIGTCQGGNPVIMLILSKIPNNVFPKLTTFDFESPFEYQPLLFLLKKLT